MELLEFLARYPFSAQAKRVLEEKHAGLDQEVLERARVKIVAAASGESWKPLTGRDEECVLEIASYAAAKLILSVLKRRSLISKFAVAEQKRLEELLRKEDDRTVEKVAGELGVKFCDGGMNVFDYVHFAPRDAYYKLVNKAVGKGVVRLGRSQRIRVVSEALKKNIETSLPARVDMVPAEIQRAAAEVEKDLPKEAPAVIRTSEADYAPCMKKLLEDLAAGENLPHQARFALATYLLNVGVPKEKVAAAFKSAPDYDEKTTSYQVEFIARKGYRVPACSPLDMQGLCVADCHVGTPLNYGQKREKKK